MDHVFLRGYSPPKSGRPLPSAARITRKPFLCPQAASVPRRFFKMSRSIRVLASSAFRRASSICSALTALPATSRNRPAASAFTQLCSVLAEIPKVFVSEEIASPPRTNRTASCLNSSVYCPRTAPCMPEPSKADPKQSALGDVFRGQGQYIFIYQYVPSSYESLDGVDGPRSPESLCQTVVVGKRPL